MNFVLLGQLEQLRSEGMTGNESYLDYEPYDEAVTSLIHLAQILYIYYIPVIICLGISLNTIVCIVLLRTKLRKKFFTHVFAATTISDNGFLFTVLLIWMKDQAVDIYKAPGMCQMIIFMSHFFPFLSFWHSVSASIILLIRPRSSCLTNTCNGPGKSRTLIISLSIFTLTIYVYKTWTNGVLVIQGARFCTILPETEEAMKILNILDVIVLLVLPFLIFAIFDLLIIVKQIMKLYLANSFNGSSTYRDSLKVVLVHSICFHVFVGPGCSSKLILLFRYMSGNEHYDYQELILESIFQYVFYTYFGIKPLFHIIVSKSLRVHLKELLLKAKQTMSMSRMLMNAGSHDQTLLWSIIIS